MSRKLRITITTESGELLDTAIIELSDKTVGITYRESDTLIPKSGNDEILIIPRNAVFE